MGSSDSKDRSRVLRHRLITSLIIFCIILLVILACGEGRRPTTSSLNIDHPAMPQLQDQTVNVGTVVTLTVTEMGSFSPEVYNYHWEINSKPEASKITLSSQTQREPTFTPDVGGKYVFMLHVNNGKSVSAPAKVTITAISNKPIAKLVYRGDLVIDQTIELDASTSYNDKNLPMTYQWQILQRPAGSNANLLHATKTVAHLRFDIAGIYKVQLTASDGSETSEPNVLVLHVYTVKTINPGLPGTDSVTPIAEAGKDVLIKTPGTIQLDGRESMDPAHRPITLRWEILSQPKTSNALISDPTSYRPSFTFDNLGPFVLKLTVTNDVGLSSFDTVVVTRHNAGLYCADCHNGEIAKDDSTHKKTHDKKDCIYCHVTTSWNAFDMQLDVVHADYVSRCAECHVKDRTAAPNHRASSDRCGHCHSTQQWLPALKLEHVFAMTYCEVCHDGTKASAKPVGHIPTGLDCALCHEKTRWKPSYSNRHEAKSRCLLCHNAENAWHNDIVKPLCDVCHSIRHWQPTTYIDHRMFYGRCVFCHNGLISSGKSPSHLPTTDKCDACHSHAAWTPTIIWDHNEVIGECFVCHNDVFMRGKPQFHIQATNNCAACHSTTSWRLAIKVDHSEFTVAGCEICHDNIMPVKPITHIATTADCGVCHTTTAWKPALR